jgi:alpha-1,6-mannosyltransferase
VSIVEAQASGLPVVGVESGAMVDRVTSRVGLLGPIQDSEAMAANILRIWRGDRAAMGEAAIQEAKQYSWQRSMESLFGIVYPQAFARRSRGIESPTLQGFDAVQGAVGLPPAA